VNPSLFYRSRLSAIGWFARVLDDIGWEMMDVLERTPAPEAAAAAAVKAE
jgi:hypothetical protein